jgi:hypothetical protein
VTIDEARANIGSGVIYRPHPQALPEDGEIVRCSDSMVFVQYVGNRQPKATRPEDLRMSWSEPTP